VSHLIQKLYSLILYYTINFIGCYGKVIQERAKTLFTYFAHIAVSRTVLDYLYTTSRIKYLIPAYTLYYYSANETL